MLDLPVQDFSGATRNFQIVEGDSTKTSASIAAINASLTSISSQITALNSSIATLNSQLALTSTNAVPTATTRLMLSGFRQMTAGSAGTSSGTPLAITDFYVEVPAGSAVTTVYLPAYNATGQFAGKVYLIRNGKASGTIVVNGVVGVTKAATTSIALAAGATIIVVNTGAKWRSLGWLAAGNTVGGVA